MVVSLVVALTLKQGVFEVANPNDQQKDFQDRIARINQRGEHADQEKVVGSRSAQRKEKRNQPSRQAKTQDQNPNILVEGFMLIVAFLVGAFSILAGKVIVFHMASEDGTYRVDEGFNLIMGMVGDIVIGIVLSMILGAILRVNYGMRVWVEFSGFMFILWFDAILMEMFPEIFAKLFSARYVMEYLYSSGLY